MRATMGRIFLASHRGLSWTLLVFLGAAVVLAAATDQQKSADGQQQFATYYAHRNKLLFILLDGFRWDYAKKYAPSDGGFAKVAEIGVRAEYSEPAFPSMSFPNYYSIATGLFSENHGMVHNYMYDRGRRQLFLMLPNANSSQPFWWEGAEPMWTTATHSDRRAYLYLWPGGEVPIRGTKPKMAIPYASEHGLHTFRQHVDDALQALRHNEADLVQVYCEYADQVGHKHGPESERMKEAVREIDGELERLLRKMDKLELKDKVNVIIVSDHGMTATDSGSVKHVTLKPFLNVDMVEFILGHGAVVSIYPRMGLVHKVYTDLSQSDDFQVWKKEDLPDHFHIKGHHRTAPILVLANKGVFINPIPGLGHFSSHRVVQIPSMSSSDPVDHYKGFHGYDPEEVEDMRGIFYAFGPEFEEGVAVPRMRNVDVYNMAMHALRVPPLPNNGSWTSVYTMVRGENDRNHAPRRVIGWSIALLPILAALLQLLLFARA